MPVGSEVRGSQTQPQESPDGLLILPRGDKYGNPFIPFVSVGDIHHAEEGALIRGTNPTIATGQTWVAAQTAFSDTTPNWYIENPSATKVLWFRRLKMIATAVATGAVAWRIAVVVDTIPRPVTTNNMQAITPKSPSNKGLNVTPTMYVQNSATASVITASSAANRKYVQGTIGGLNIVSDELEAIFGSIDAGGFTGTADAAGQPSRKVSMLGAIGIPPGGSGVIHIWGPSSSASLAPEWELDLIAR